MSRHEVEQLSALAITHARLREDNAQQRKIVAEYEHYCVLLEQTLANMTQVPVAVIRNNYKNGRPMLSFNNTRQNSQTSDTDPLLR